MLMLRITSSSTPTEQRWILCGQLAGPWVAELKMEWECRRQESGGRRSVVDLSDVTFIDEGGEALLREMRSAGVEFVASGVDTKDILENLGVEGKRPLRRFVTHLTSGCGESHGD